ncbi:isoprenylcysteine carboxyl methyltransferase family protein [Virgibacillus doumboii]|uniref:isoprenylcysteine carboxyl methyltransferase family protein n=1 Tax=Virgibacillus doumboii TaxID=2697503 RepID=UPI0013E04D38|nr:isoprenylcysteine carboxylmethyltransferase family protein [Virgibacillus doumboii]
MTTWMWLFIIAVIAQRLAELYIAKRNEVWMKSKGGIEKGEKHYKLFILLHCLFFTSMILEATLYDHSYAGLNYFLLSIFVLSQIGRIWCIQTLGKFWNTKVIVLPGVALIKKGPYKYVKHPNYIIVAAELFVIPFLIGAPITGMIFPVLHLLLLKIRIPSEEKALTKATP